MLQIVMIKRFNFLLSIVLTKLSTTTSTLLVHSMLLRALSMVNKKFTKFPSLFMFCLFYEQKYHLHSTQEQINHYYTSFYFKKKHIPKYVNMGIIL